MVQLAHVVSNGHSVERTKPRTERKAGKVAIVTAEQVVSLSTAIILPQGGGFKTVHHNYAGANNTGFTNFDTFSYHRIAADKGAPPDRRPTIDYCRSRDVTVIFNHRIVLDECFRVNDAIISHTCPAVHNGLMHDNRPLSKDRILGDMSEGENDRRNRAMESLQKAERSLAY